MDAADAERIQTVRQKATRYSASAREALRQGDKMLAEQYWKWWHETVDEIFSLMGAS
jgi:hypothetical protein